MRRAAVKGMGAVLALAALAACNADRLNIPNYNNATPEQVLGDPVAALPLLASGVLRDDRGNHPGFVLGVGILGREAYNYTPTEGRNTSGFLTTDVNNQASFGGVALWSGYYTTLRDIQTMLKVAEGATQGLFSEAQLNAVRGFAHTMEALQLSYVIAARHSLGAPVTLDEDPTVLSPFVSRDSVYNYIIARLNQADTELGGGGTAFPFTFHAGFAGFNTPANFRKFNRALAARINAYRASLGVSGCGAAKSAACYQQALTALSSSFIDAAGSMTTGPLRVFSSAAGDLANGNGNSNNSSVVAHATIDAGLQAGDTRATKITKISSKAPGNATLGIATTWDHTVYTGPTSSIPIIRNEELMLLRAEARYYTGDQAGALADINTVRASAGLAALTGFASETAFLDELLYNRKWSLLFEGHRWIDMRRFGRLETLPKDMANHIVAAQLPVPQLECLARANAEASLKAPGCI
jgi:starch-binding outer membrane protein, SusD/RagB family